MPSPEKKTCFVVMGFGLKTDYATGRTLDLDKTYHQIIKKAVEDAGLECIRADDIIHAGVIDKPMYELLLNAAVVVADLSTSNLNAVYELGVRHALKPNTTIIIAENQFRFPFDIGHISIRHYEHLGNGIEQTEADRMQVQLREAVKFLADRQDTDSPVYTFLPTLRTPSLELYPGRPHRIGPEKRMLPANDSVALPPPTDAHEESGPVDSGGVAIVNELLEEAHKQGDWDLAIRLSSLLITTKPGAMFINSILLELFGNARKSEHWSLCVSLLNKLLTRKVNDVYLQQQLALATYKSKLPTKLEALANAKDILSRLNPYQTTDPETLGLWGAVHKRLWEETSERNYLEDSIAAYEKGFILKNDFYNGINLAFLLNVRASVSVSVPREAQADVVNAERVRRKVILICKAILNKENLPNIPVEYVDNEEQRFWVQASLVEAYIGIGEDEHADELRQSISKTAPEAWMIETMDEQLGKLRNLLMGTPSQS